MVNSLFRQGFRKVFSSTANFLFYEVCLGAISGILLAKESDYWIFPAFLGSISILFYIGVNSGRWTSNIKHNLKLIYSNFKHNIKLIYTKLILPNKKIKKQGFTRVYDENSIHESVFRELERMAKDAKGTEEALKKIESELDSVMAVLERTRVNV